MSFLDLAWERLGIDPVAAGVRLVDAERFAVEAAGDAGPLLVAQVLVAAPSSRRSSSPSRSPPARRSSCTTSGSPTSWSSRSPWSELDRTLEPDHLTSLYLPSSQAPVGHELARCARGRAGAARALPVGRASRPTSRSCATCSRRPTRRSRRSRSSATTRRRPAAAVAHLEEELGDVLCQVLFHATLAAEEGLFNLGRRRPDGSHDKLVRRHPHVFGDATATTPTAVLATWEQHKQRRRAGRSLLDGIPAALPALAGPPRRSASWPASSWAGR